MISVDSKKTKDSLKHKNKNAGYNIFDDKNIESLMKYYKLDKPDVLIDYIKKHRLTKGIDDTPLEKKLR